MYIWIWILLIIIVLGIASLFLLRPKYIPQNTQQETSQDSSGNLPSSQERHELPMMFLEEDIQRPYTTKPIMNVDDYEYNLVFKNEGDREITKETRDKLMSQYPMDWSTHPPSSDTFQQGMLKYKDSFTNPQPPPNVNVFYKIDASSMIPPDLGGAEEQEREILQTYVPKDPKSLTTYDAADAKEIIERIYKAKGLKATYAETGPNQITVYSTRPIDKDIVYEDDTALATSDANPQNGEDKIIIPSYMSNGPANTGLDPFFTPSTETRDGRYDYTSWTPGLERMFAPNEPTQNWY